MKLHFYRVQVNITLCNWNTSVISEASVPQLIHLIEERSVINSRWKIMKSSLHKGRIGRYKWSHFALTFPHTFFSVSRWCYATFKPEHAGPCWWRPESSSTATTNSPCCTGMPGMLTVVLTFSVLSRLHLWPGGSGLAIKNFTDVSREGTPGSVLTPVLFVPEINIF